MLKVESACEDVVMTVNDDWRFRSVAHQKKMLAPPPNIKKKTPRSRMLKPTAARRSLSVSVHPICFLVQGLAQPCAYIYMFLAQPPFTPSPWGVFLKETLICRLRKLLMPLMCPPNKPRCCNYMDPNLNSASTASLSLISMSASGPARFLLV